MVVSTVPTSSFSSSHMVVVWSFVSSDSRLGDGIGGTAALDVEASPDLRMDALERAFRIVLVNACRKVDGEVGDFGGAAGGLSGDPLVYEEYGGGGGFVMGLGFGVGSGAVSSMLGGATRRTLFMLGTWCSCKGACSRLAALWDSGAAGRTSLRGSREAGGVSEGISGCGFDLSCRGRIDSFLGRGTTTACSAAVEGDEEYVMVGVAAFGLGLARATDEAFCFAPIALTSSCVYPAWTSALAQSGGKPESPSSTWTLCWSDLKPSAHASRIQNKAKDGIVTHFKAPRC